MTEEAHVLSTIDRMTDAFHRGDLEGILSTYEPGAIVGGAPNAPVRGDGPLRDMFRGFIAANARFTFREHEVLVTGDLALHVTPWTMSGVGPDGGPITASGLSVSVLRRRPDGEWRLVIDQPYGDALLRAPAGPSTESAR